MTERDRGGDWIQTYTGRAFWPLDPDPEEVDLLDIATALSRICRYNGHCLKFYSVAEHCIHVASLLPDHLKLWGLLHDASEAYICDIPRPIKPHLTNYYAIEEVIMRAIAERFQLLPTEIPAEVKYADNQMLTTEQLQIMSPPPRLWTHTGVAPLPNFVLPCYSPDEAYTHFLSTFLDVV